MTYIPPPQNYIQLEDGYLVIDSCQTISPQVNRGIQFNIGGTPQLYLSPYNTIPGHGTGILGVDNDGGIYWTSPGSSVTWNNDLAGSTATNQYVAAISGNNNSGGSIPINATSLAFGSTQTSPSLLQTTVSTNGATGATLTVQAQNASGTTSTGGELILASGTGTSNPGEVSINLGATAALTITNSGGAVISIPSFATAGIVHNAVTTGNLTSSLVVNADISATAAIATTKIAAGSAAQILLSNASPASTWTTLSQDGYISSSGALTVTDAQAGDIVFGTGATRGQIAVASAVSNAGLTQTLTSTNSATASNLTIKAQNATGTTSTGGNVIITPGTGTSTNGNTQITCLNSTTNAIVEYAPAQGTPVSHSGNIIHYTGYCTVLNNTVTVLTIPLPTNNTSVSVSCFGVWRVTTTTGLGSTGGQDILLAFTNLAGSVAQAGSGANIAGPIGTATYNSEISYTTAISAKNCQIQLTSSTATNSFACTVYAIAVFS